MNKEMHKQIESDGAREQALVEEGAAFMSLHARERFEVIVIGAGQAGLSVGYHLARQGLRFVILDAGDRIGDSWRRRWDSLRLFTPARLDGLVGMRFPAPANEFPTKDQMADYLEAYAARFKLPVRTGVRVDRLYRRDGRYVVQAGEQVFEADQVVVAMASYQKQRIPEFARQLSPDIVQLHSSDYRNLAQLRPGPVLIAGAGNSGSEIALEAARAGHPTVMAGRDVGQIPFRINGLAARLFLAKLVLRVLFHRVLTIRTPIGRKIRPAFTSHGGPLIRVKRQDLAALGIERASKVAGVKDGRPVLEDGRALDVASVVWCTGYHPSHAWIDLPIFDAEGRPRHDGGVVEDQPGLYFVGLNFLYAVSSTMIHGVGRDAGRIVKRIAARVKARAPVPAAAVSDSSWMTATSRR
jgi:putative flavoprotein involved in K+ transport